MTQLSITQQCDPPNYSATTHPGDSAVYFATVERKSEETRCSTTISGPNESTNCLMDKLAFANHEAARSAPMDRSNLFPATFKLVNPDTTIPNESRPRAKLIRSQLAKSLTQALANLS
jgi:hypothetical protein